MPYSNGPTLKLETFPAKRKIVNITKLFINQTISISNYLESKFFLKLISVLTVAFLF
jgi:hypothetical protein